MMQKKYWTKKTKFTLTVKNESIFLGIEQLMSGEKLVITDVSEFYQFLIGKKSIGHVACIFPKTRTKGTARVQLNTERHLYINTTSPHPIFNTRLSNRGIDKMLEKLIAKYLNEGKIYD